MKVRIARMLAPVSVLGPGRRLALWVQGCHLACPGCASVDTWASDAGEEVDIEDLATRMAHVLIRDDLDGLTITGGEPTEQGEALAHLVADVRARVAQHRGDLDLLVFTGRTQAAATLRASALVAAADALVAGRYRADLPPTNPLVASANQTITWRSSAAEARYREWFAHLDRPTLEVAASGEDLFLIGLPRAGDLDRFRRSMRDRGVFLDSVSWRA